MIGAMLSYSMTNCVAAELLFQSPSCATLQATSTVTFPSVIGAISTVYVSPSTAKKLPLHSTAFHIVYSPRANPVTTSLNWKVIVIEVSFVGSVDDDVITTVGQVVSYVIVNCVAAALLFPAAS